MTNIHSNSRHASSVRLCCLVLCLTFLCSNAVSNATERPQIGIRVTPDNVVLGETPEAEILVDVRDSRGPVSCETIRIHSNTGSVSPLRSRGTGSYASRFLLPDDFFPRFALIAAVGTCNGVLVEGHTVFPLYGAGEVEVKSQPYSDVTLKIGDKTFGPRRTNMRGVAHIPIVAPPGHFTGIAGDKTVDLKLPPVNRIVAIADRTHIKAGEEGRIVVWIFAIDQKGAPLVHGELSATANKGTVSEPEAVAPGVYRAFYTGPTRIGDHQGDISVSIDGDPASTDGVKFVFTPGTPSDIRILPGTPAYEAGSNVPMSLEVAVVDQYGNPTGDEVTVHANFGTLSPLAPAAHGAFQTTIEIPDRFDGRKAITLTATGGPGDRLSEVFELPLKAGTPVSIAIEIPDRPVPADGLRTIPLPVIVKDAFENPVTDLTLNLTASAGEVPATIITDYETTIPYIPPHGAKSGEAHIVVDGETLTTEADIKLTDKTYLFATTARFGFITNFHGMTAPYLTLSLEQNLWFLLKGLHAAVELGYYYAGTTDDRKQLSWSLHAFPLNVLIGYRLTPIPKLFVSVGFGLGADILRNRMAYVRSYESVDWGAQVGIQGMASGGYLLGPGHLILRIGYLHAVDSNVSLMTGQSAGFNVTMGYRIQFM